MDTQSNDADLAQRVLMGPDPEAEAELCRRMLPRVRLYGLRHLRNATAAQDLAQQVLIIALEALRSGQLRDPEKLASFVLGVCRMTVLELRRGTQRRQRLLEQYGRQFEAAANEPEPQPDLPRLTECLERLKERDRSVIVLTFYDDQTSADVAAFLGVSEANVRVIRHRALQQLRDCMGVTQ